MPDEILTMSSMHRRGRQFRAGGIPTVVEPEPAKILTMSDLPRRMTIAQKAAAVATVPSVVHMGTMGRIGETQGPQVFANHVASNAWKGRRCFIIGGGPSLKRQSLKGLAGELVIGINRAYELLDPSILYGVDGQLFGWVESGKLGRVSKQKFGKYGGYKVWMALHKMFPNDFHLINMDSSAEHKIGTTEKLSFKNNSGYGAINLAAALGVSEIYLLGFDMCGDCSGKQKWWHKGYPVDYGEGIYAKYIAAIEGLAPVLADAGIKVVNLSKQSRLGCFPFGELRSVLATKPDRPVVVSFYTIGTGYEKEAQRLVRELHLFGFEHDIEGIQSFGSWQANTQYKAKFIAGMMDKYPQRSILWLDVDSSICQYPDVFDDADFDLGVHKIDWAKYTPLRKDKQLANAVIYLKNTDKVRQFVSAWIKLNTEQPDRIEMQTMAEVLDKWESKLNFHNLPASYCQIYDMMASEGQPVIEQRQASRHYRGEVDALGDVVARERKKYDDCWTKYYEHASGCAKPLIQHVLGTVRKGDKVLDIGCGDCTTLMGLRDAGVDCTGVDISLAGVPDGVHNVLEAPLWDMPFEDGQFDYTVSTDVLEHVPTELIPKAIEEIFRVTKRQSFHVVALFPGICKGVVLHMTVKPIEWWIDQFTAVQAKTKRQKDNLIITSRDMFMAKYGKK